MSQLGFSSSNLAKQMMNMVTELSWVFPKQLSLGLDGWPSKITTIEGESALKDGLHA
jgi:hypothetical protein